MHPSVKENRVAMVSASCAAWSSGKPGKKIGHAVTLHGGYSYSSNIPNIPNIPAISDCCTGGTTGLATESAQVDDSVTAEGV